MMLGKNIRFMRKTLGWSQEFLAEKLNYKSYTTIQKWEMGTSEPPVKTVRKLAELFNIDMDVLATFDLQSLYTRSLREVGSNEYAEALCSFIQRMEQSKTVEKYIPPTSSRIPVYGCIPAGLPLEAIDCIEGYVDVPAEWLAKGDEYFGLRVKGDSMSPKYLDGDLIILRRQPDCESGQDAAVRVNGDEATLKKVVKLTDGIMLQPLNPDYTPRQYDYTDEDYPIEIMGVVVQLRRDV